MHTRNWYFGEVLDENNMDVAFGNVQAHVDGGRLETVQGFITAGICTGLQVSSYGAANNTFQVSAGAAIDPFGRRINTRDGGTLGNNRQTYATDTAGNSTDPGAGNYRWVSIFVRLGKSLQDPQTDDLGNTVYASNPDTWNSNGFDFFDPSTQAQNAAGDGGEDFDTNGFSITGFYVVAGPAVVIGNPLTYPASPADGVLLADILYTDGEQGAPLNNSTIYKNRESRPRRITNRPQVFAGLGPAHYTQLWKIFGDNYSTRFYQGENGLVITMNAVHQNIVDGTFTWGADILSIGDPVASIKISFTVDGIVMQQKDAGNNGTHWSDATWDRLSFFPATGDVYGDSDLLGYVSLSSSAAHTAARTAIQFSRQFRNTPSTITFGSPGPSEGNVSGVAGVNISIYGADFLVTTTASGSFIAQREYTVSI